MSRAKNPKYKSMSLEELKVNIEKSKKELEHAIHNKNLLELQIPIKRGTCSAPTVRSVQFKRCGAPSL